MDYWRTLFRGISIENPIVNPTGKTGDWVFGGIETISHSNNEIYYNINCDEGDWYDGYYCKTYKVHSDTVQQCTGIFLPDFDPVNPDLAKVIFEGDILEFSIEEHKYCGVVSWDERYLRWVINYNGGATLPLSNINFIKMRIVENSIKVCPICKGRGNIVKEKFDIMNNWHYTFDYCECGGKIKNILEGDVLNVCKEN